MRLLHNRVLVRVLPQPRTGVLILLKDRQEYGAVLAVGPKCVELAPGDLIYFPNNIGETYCLDGRNLLIVPEKEIPIRVEGDRYAST